MKLGTKIKKARKRSELTQKQLAALVGVTPLTISRWERGETKPSRTSRKVLAAVLEATEISENVTAEEMFYEVKEFYDREFQNALLEYMGIPIRIKKKEGKEERAEN